MGKRTGKHHYLIGQDNRSASELDLDTRLELLLEEKDAWHFLQRLHQGSKTQR